MQIWDTAGQEKFRSIVQQYYKGAMGIILTYSVTDKRSFQNIEGWMKQIAVNAPDAVIVLVGNKADLNERQVQTEDGQQLAEKFGLKFYETSAKVGTNVEEVFHDVAIMIRGKLGEENLKAMEKKIIKPGDFGNNKGDTPIMQLDPARSSPKTGDGEGCKC
jgi:GTPase SAR1 family protein